jgi:hypothetical protein
MRKDLLSSPWQCPFTAAINPIRCRISPCSLHWRADAKVENGGLWHTNVERIFASLYDSVQSLPMELGSTKGATS